MKNSCRLWSFVRCHPDVLIEPRIIIYEFYFISKIKFEYLINDFYLQSATRKFSLSVISDGNENLLIFLINVLAETSSLIRL